MNGEILLFASIGLFPNTIDFFKTFRIALLQLQMDLCLAIKNNNEKIIMGSRVFGKWTQISNDDTKTNTSVHRFRMMILKQILVYTGFE